MKRDQYAVNVDRAKHVADKEAANALTPVNYRLSQCRVGEEGDQYKFMFVFRVLLKSSKAIHRRRLERVKKNIIGCMIYIGASDNTNQV